MNQAWFLTGCLAWFLAGLAIGFGYFTSLWWNTRLFTAGGSARSAILLMICRFAILGGGLTLASLGGALPLLITAQGVLTGRFAVMRRMRPT